MIQEIQNNVNITPVLNRIGKNDELSNKNLTTFVNYRTFNQPKVDYFRKQKENALPYLAEVLGKSQNEDEIVEHLYIFDREIEHGTKGVEKMYPVLSRFNNTKNPEIQTYLAGIYRKIQVPDAFGPLVKMLIQNSIKPNNNTYFDPNEEIGGAILSYISNRFG